MKKLLLLGGSRYLIPAIKVAHELGVYVITCDYLPQNIAHRFSDEYHNVSIVDKEAVLGLAKELKVDGIMSYATDPGVITAAYVAEKMGLPGNPYESVKILQNKGLFREFLKDNGFNVPEARSFTNINEAVTSANLFKWPVIVKPVDSAGSKGVCRVDDLHELESAIKNALDYSLGKTFIIEEFIEKQGASTDTDSFSINGELVFCSFNDQWFDQNASNPYTPAAYSWPSTMAIEHQKYLRKELQRLIHLLGMKTSIYNIETRLGVDGKPYIMEVTPRAGGNRLSEILKFACGQDLVAAAVRGALGMEVQPLIDPVYNGWWGECILHSNSDGRFHSLQFNNEIKNNIVETDVWVKAGDYVHKFSGANETIGTLVIRCDTHAELLEKIKNIGRLVTVITQPE